MIRTNNAIHVFNCLDKYFIFDVESGALHQIDQQTFTYLATGKLDDEVLAQEIDQELSTLIDNGSLYADAPKGYTPQKSDVIKSLCLHVSHDCNLRCAYCFASQGSYCGERLNMSAQVGFDAIDFLIAHSGNRKNLEVDFFGGEPLLNLDVVKQIVEYANKRGAECNKDFLFTTTTNGLLLNQDTADYLNKTMENVVLSLDGRKIVNDRTRKTATGHGSYDLIVDKFKYFKSIRKGGSYYVRGTYTRDNTDFCADVLHINDLGFDSISVEPVVLPEGNELSLREQDLPALYEQYELLAKEYLKRRAGDKWFSFFHFVLDLNNSPCYKKKLVGCGAGYEYLAVSPQGDIYPCHQFVGEEDWKMGNVSTGELRQDIRAQFGACNLTTKPDCTACWARYQCSGGCNANAVHFNGDLNKPYALSCKLFRKRLECALYIYATENTNSD